MDKEPELPRRPSGSTVDKSKSSFTAGSLYRLTSEEAALWDYVPPVPDDNGPPLFQDQFFAEKNDLSNHRSNILYELNLSGCPRNGNSISRPNTLFKNNRSMSASSEQISSANKNRAKHHLIDWNSTFDQNGNNHHRNSQSDPPKRSHSLIPNMLAGHNINFQLNPLYHKISPNSMNNIYQNNIISNRNDSNLYANLYWSTNDHHSSSLPATSPISPPAAYPMYNPNHPSFQKNNIDHEINQQLIEKIRTTSFRNKNINDASNTSDKNKNHLPNVLMPTTIYEASPEDPKQIINLFDPLAVPIPPAPTMDYDNSMEHKYVNVNPSHNNNNVATEQSFKKNVEDIANNNSIAAETRIEKPNVFRQESSETQINANLFACFKVEHRDNFNKEFDEFCEHLKSLYMTFFTNKSSSSCDINSGLVYSPRIDIDVERTLDAGNQSDRLYLYGMANTTDSSVANRKSSDLSSSQYADDLSDNENLIIIDVRFHSLIFTKITGQTPNTSNLVSRVKPIGANNLWFSMKFPVDFDKTVDMIVSHVVLNVAENEDSKVNPGDFLLKLNGINEFLQPDTSLSSYVYFQNCKKNNQHVILELVDQTSPDFWRPFLRCESDTKQILNDWTSERILPKNFITNFIGYNASKMNDLIDELNFSYTEFISSFDGNLCLSQNRKQLVDKILEKIASLCKFLSNVESTELMEAIKNFKSLVENNSNQDLTIRDQIEKSYLYIIQALINIIRIYTKTFPVAFKLPKINDKVPKAISFEDDEQQESKFVTLKRKRKREISQIMDMFSIHVDVAVQISEKWSNMYPNCAIIVCLFHGFDLIKAKITGKVKVQGSSANKKLIFDQKLTFDTPIHILPRETRLEFILVGYRSASNRPEVDALATTFCYLYDNDAILQNGSHLLPWIEMKAPITLSGISFEFDSDNRSAIMREFLQNNYQVTHNLDPNVPLLVINVAPNLPANVEYSFPEINTKQITLNFVIPFQENLNATILEDSLYGFHGCNPDLLDSNVITILQKNPIEYLTQNEKESIWKNRHTLRQFPGSILKILKSPPSWSCHDLRDVYEILEDLDSGPFQRVFRTKIEALQLLSLDYPDKIVRRTVVKWLNSVSVDELCDYLPQLVQSLRFETSFDSHLIWSLLEFSLMSARFCHYFFWQLKSCLDDPAFGLRCQIYLNSLLLLCGERTREQFQQQEKTCEQFSQISAEIKQKSRDSRGSILKQKLDQVNEDLKSNPTSIPLSPSLFVNGLEINQCSYFNSNSLPLKLVFNSAPPYRINKMQNGGSGQTMDSSKQLMAIYESKPWFHKIIFKCGDDLRKDMLVMQIISIINRVWFRAGLNLRLIIFGVLNTSDRTGMIEMVSRANTLREIQLEHGLTGNFKHHTIATWLKRHNTNEYDYKIAVENFIHSCAGYLVITYLLGICDRHNDNIMVTTSGNLFHIDFGKFFGDAQMMAGIKRDRVPFVFTADMAFVINEGGRPSKNYQFFVDLCCRCFILVRQNGNFLLSLLSMMIGSGVDYLSAETIQYFHKALMPDSIESEAKVKFNRMIEKACRSLSTQLNFFIHSIAQNFSGSGGNSSPTTAEDRQSNFNTNPFPDSVYETVASATPDYDELPNLDNDSESCYFSFTKCPVTEAMDGHITQLEIVDCRLFVPEKNEKIYFYKVKVDRRKMALAEFVYRSFKEFLELHDKMTQTFPLVKFHPLKRSPMLNRSSRQEIAAQRKREIQCFLKGLLQLASEISHNTFVYTFFHPIQRDHHFHDIEQDPTLIMSTNGSISSIPSVSMGNVYIRQPKIKLHISFREEALHVLVCHVRNLDSDRVTVPDSYVKLYLKPDPNKSTKRKTRIMPKNAHPTFMERFVYPITVDQLITKTLEVSVWEKDLTGNKPLGQVVIPCDGLTGKIEKWFQLKN